MILEKCETFIIFIMSAPHNQLAIYNYSTKRDLERLRA